MAATRSAATKLDWAKITHSLGLKGQTAASLAAFKKRNDDARRKVNSLSTQPQSVDFEHYRSVLSHSTIVDEIEGQVKGFKPKTYDLGRQLKAIEAFEAQAVKSAQETKDKVDEQVKDLEVTLKNIREVRGFEDLTVDDIAKAEPRLDEYTAKMVAKGRWGLPGQSEKWGDTSMF